MKIPPKISSFSSILILIFFIFNPLSIGKIRINTETNASSIDLINEINNLRLSNGLPPYSIDQRLMGTAQNQSDYQASIGTVTHYGPDGSRPYERALNAGYPVAGDISLGGFFSENIAAGRNLTVSGVVQSWQQDSPHLNTMLSSTYQDIGAGVTIVEDVVYYTIDVGLASGSTISIPAEGSQETQSYHPANINQIITNTPHPDGTIIHVVKIGETLWGISQVYGVPVDEILLLNNLPNDYIFVGDEFLIKEGSGATETLEPTITQTISKPTNTPMITEIPRITTTPIIIDRENSESMDDQFQKKNLTYYVPFILFISVFLFIILRMINSAKVK